MLMRAATVVQVLQTFKFYCMFYFTCDRSFRAIAASEGREETGRKRKGQKRRKVKGQSRGQAAKKIGEKVREEWEGREEGYWRHPSFQDLPAQLAVLTWGGPRHMMCKTNVEHSGWLIWP